MTTLRTIVSDALRESAIIQIGTDPAAEEFEEGLRRLEVVIANLFGNELGDQLETVTYGTSGIDLGHADDCWTDRINSNYLPVNIRAVFNIDAAKTIYLDPNPRDGARFALIDNLDTFATYNVVLDANGRSIEDTQTVTLATNGLNREWFYRADLGNWARVTELDENSDSPFPREFDDYLITLLAFRMNPRLGEETRQETMATMQMMKTRFRNRYRQRTEVPSELALQRMHPWNNGFGFSDNHRFNVGR
jgi:hypothetical protein